MNNPDTGNHVLTATAISGSAGQQLPGRAAPTRRCSTTVTGADPGPDHHPDRQRHRGGARGQVVGYTLTVTNTGQTPYTGATVTDSLAEVLDDAAYDSDASGHRRHGVVRQPRC